MVAAVRVTGYTKRATARRDYCSFMVVPRSPRSTVLFVRSHDTSIRPFVNSDGYGESESRLGRRCNRSLARGLCQLAAIPDCAVVGWLISDLTVPRKYAWRDRVGAGGRERGEEDEGSWGPGELSRVRAGKKRGTNIGDKTPSRAAINCWRGGAITAAPATESPRERCKVVVGSGTVVVAAATAAAAAVDVGGAESAVIPNVDLRANFCV